MASFTPSPSKVSRARQPARPRRRRWYLFTSAQSIDGLPANAVQPAETPEGGSYAPNREYFLSTPDFNGFATMGGAGAKAVVLWTLSNTDSLSSATPSLTLTHAILPSEAYTPPVNATQKPGPRPLGDSARRPRCRRSPVNDDRMQQVEYSARQSCTRSLNTASRLQARPVRLGRGLVPSDGERDQRAR